MFSEANAPWIVTSLLALVAATFQYLSTRRDRQERNTSTADAARIISEAAGTSVTSLIERVAKLESRITQLEDELETEREQARMLWAHVRRLEGVIWSLGGEPPPLTFPKHDDGTNSPEG